MKPWTDDTDLLLAFDRGYRMFLEGEPRPRDDYSDYYNEAEQEGWDEASKERTPYVK